MNIILNESIFTEIDKAIEEHGAECITRIDLDEKEFAQLKCEIHHRVMPVGFKSEIHETRPYLGSWAVYRGVCVQCCYEKGAQAVFDNLRKDKPRIKDTLLPSSTEKKTPKFEGQILDHVRCKKEKGTSYSELRGFAKSLKVDEDVVRKVLTRMVEQGTLRILYNNPVNKSTGCVYSWHLG